VQIRQFLDVVGFAYSHQQIQLLGFGTSLNSTVAASPEHSVYLSIFQLPERAHRPIQIFQLTTIWNLFPVAETSLVLYPTTCSASSSQSSLSSPSTTLGNYPRLGQQFHSAISHGKETQIQ
jgi:hypothetical protein